MPSFSTTNHSLQFGNNSPTVTISGSDFDGYINYDMSPSGTFYQFVPNTKYFALKVIFDQPFQTLPSVLINPANSNTAGAISSSIEFFVDQSDVTTTYFKISAITSSSNLLLGPISLIISFQISAPHANPGTVYQLNTTSRLSGGPITTIGTIDLAASGVTPGTKNGLTFDAYGRITATPSGHLVADGYTINLSGGVLSNQILQYNGTSFVAVAAPSSASIGTEVFGLGLSSAIDIATNTSLNTDVAATTVIVHNNSTLTTSNFRMAATTSIVVSSNSLIESEGQSAVNGIGGVATSAKTLGAGGSGGNGLANGDGYNGDDVTGFGGSGSDGGGGSGHQPGVAGVVQTPNSSLGTPTLPPVLYGRLLDSSVFGGGAGGPAGGADGAIAGGGGGAGGGVMWIASPLIDLSAGGVISVRGGDGYTAGDNVGPGGGGGGGVLITLGFVKCGTSGLIDISGGFQNTDASHGFVTPIIGLNVAETGKWYALGGTDCAIPLAPTLSGMMSGSDVVLSWTPHGCAAYLYSITLMGGPVLYVKRNITSFTLLHADPGSYTFQMSSTNALGTSPLSNSVVIVVP